MGSVRVLVRLYIFLYGWLEEESGYWPAMVLYLQFMVVLHLLLVARSMAMYLFWGCFFITFFFVAYHIYGQFVNNLIVIVLDKYAFIPLLQISFVSWNNQTHRLYGLTISLFSFFLKQLGFKLSIPTVSLLYSHPARPVFIFLCWTLGLLVWCFELEN